MHNEGRKRSWTNLRCYPGICLDVLSKITETLDRRASTRAEVRGRDSEGTIAVPETVSVIQISQSQNMLYKTAI